jgi:hypothetical protein
MDLIARDESSAVVCYRRDFCLWCVGKEMKFQLNGVESHDLDSQLTNYLLDSFVGAPKYR